MLPSVAVVDPELTLTMPPPVTASTGLDALIQNMEPYVSKLANPLTDAICREGMQRAGRSLRRAYENGQDSSVRTDMALASLMGGLALANAKLGAVHGFAGVIGGMFPAPHGVVCARLLPYVMETNVRALQARAPDAIALVRYDDIAQILTGKKSAKAADGVSWVFELCAALEIPPLSEFGLTEADFPEVVEKSQKASSMKGNPIPLTDNELVEILRQAV
jgi:alcohol dehydrogenase class IV